MSLCNYMFGGWWCISAYTGYPGKLVFISNYLYYNFALTDSRAVQNNLVIKEHVRPVSPWNIRPSLMGLCWHPSLVMSWESTQFEARITHGQLCYIMPAVQFGKRTSLPPAWFVPSLWLCVWLMIAAESIWVVFLWCFCFCGFRLARQSALLSSYQQKWRR